MDLRNRQQPLKTQYQQQPETAQVKLHSRGTLVADDLVCRVETSRGAVDAGLHPAAGGDGSHACSGDMLLDALVACAGVTLAAVATALAIPLRGGTISATGIMDFRGTLGVDRTTPVGITDVQLDFELDTDATPQQLEKLLQLTERYCVIYRTLTQPPRIVTRIAATGSD